MQIPYEFFLVKFGNIILKFCTRGSLSNLTFEIYVGLSDWLSQVEISQLKISSIKISNAELITE